MFNQEQLAAIAAAMSILQQQQQQQQQQRTLLDQYQPNLHHAQHHHLHHLDEPPNHLNHFDDTHKLLTQSPLQLHDPLPATALLLAQQQQQLEQLQISPKIVEQEQHHPMRLSPTLFEQQAHRDNHAYQYKPLHLSPEIVEQQPSQQPQSSPKMVEHQPNNHLQFTPKIVDQQQSSKQLFSSPSTVTAAPSFDLTASTKSRTKPPTSYSSIVAKSTSTVRTVPPHGRATNLLGFMGLYVGNLSPDLTKEQLEKIFSKYGEPVKAHRLIRSPVAFIKYDNTESPRAAIDDLYGLLLPDLTLNQDQPLKLHFDRNDTQLKANYRPTYLPKEDNGECYGWRTTVCRLGRSCPKKHIPINRGIDFQMWMVKSNNTSTSASSSSSSSTATTSTTVTLTNSSQTPSSVGSIGTSQFRPSLELACKR